MSLFECLVPLCAEIEEDVQYSSEQLAKNYESYKALFDVPELRDMIMSKLDYASLRALCSTDKDWKRFCDEVGWGFWKELLRHHLTPSQINYVLYNPFDPVEIRYGSPQWMAAFYQWLDHAQYETQRRPISWPNDGGNPFTYNDDGDIVSFNIEQFLKIDDDAQKNELHEKMVQRVQELGLGFLVSRETIMDWIEKFHVFRDGTIMNPPRLSRILVFIWIDVMNLPHMLLNDDRFYIFLVHLDSFIRGDALSREISVETHIPKSEIRDSSYIKYITALMRYPDTEHNYNFMEDFFWLRSLKAASIKLGDDKEENARRLTRKIKIYLDAYTKQLTNTIAWRGSMTHPHTVIYTILSLKTHTGADYINLLYQLLRTGLKQQWTWIMLLLFKAVPGYEGEYDSGFEEEKTWIANNFEGTVMLDTVYRKAILYVNDMKNWKGEATILMLIHHAFLYLIGARHGTKARGKAQERIALLQSVFAHDTENTLLYTTTSSGDNVMHFTLGWMIRGHDAVRFPDHLSRGFDAYPYTTYELDLLLYYARERNEDMQVLMNMENADGVTPQQMLEEYVDRMTTKLLDFTEREYQHFIMHTTPQFLRLTRILKVETDQVRLLREEIKPDI